VTVPLYPEPCVAIDLETTGLQPGSDQIIEIGAVLFRGEDVLGTYHQMVDPGRSLPQFITLLTGIKPDDLKGAPLFEAVAPALTEFIGDRPIVGQNVSFDLTFLANKGVRPPGPVFDTREMSRLIRPDAADHGLTSLSAAFGVINESPHRALADAETTMKVFQALWERLGDVEAETLAMARSLALRAGASWPLGRLVETAARLRDVAPGTSSDVIRALLKRLGPPAPARSPIRPRLVRERVAPERMAALFAPDGPVAKALDSYEPRPQQATMASRIVEALDDGKRLMVEAPPGTGKSLAYLAPALAFAHANHAPVAVATSTRGLQEQLANKDLPNAMRALGLDYGAVPVAVLKGRGNYLCLSRLAVALERPDLTPDEVGFLARLLVWLESTQRGDIGELSLNEQETVLWSALSASTGEEHATCSFQREGNCFLARSRREAQGAHLVITNHALLLADSAHDGGVLEHVKHLILDEAHNLEDEATDQYGRRVTQREVDDLLGALGATTGRPRLLTNALAQASAAGAPARVEEMARQGEAVAGSAAASLQRARALFSLLNRMFGRQKGDSGDNGESRVRLTRAVRQRQEWRPVSTAWEDLDAALSETGRALGKLHDLVEDVTSPDVAHALEDLNKRVGELRSKLELVVTPSGEGGIAWVDVQTDNRHGMTLQWAPLSVAPLLQSGLFHERESIVLTSATLTTAGSFAYLKRRLGLDDAEELLLDSPFDYANAAAVFAPRDMPGPDASGYGRAVEQTVAQLAMIADGGVLVLFTAYSALRQAYNYLKNALQERGITVLGQGTDGPPARLAEMMRTQPHTVVLGAASFWEGVDLAGDALKVLIIARLPFAVPNDPIVAARSETYVDAFNEFTLPVSLLRFRQGVGRLIRSSKDQGAIVLLDSRVVTRAYGAVFLQALPTGAYASPSLSDLPTEVANWLHGGMRPASRSK
jgi:DNA polymerase-3 subunit epsilon/ATP-dependent DNA helicase DinG